MGEELLSCRSGNTKCQEYIITPYLTYKTNIIARKISLDGNCFGNTENW